MPGGGISVEVRDNVAIVYMDRGENRLNLKFMADLNSAFDKVLSYPDVQAMVTTGVGKFYSNGIQLTWLLPAALDVQLEFWHKFSELQMRILTFPIPTVAAINGHCVAGGGLLALCHDYRVMRTKQGWFYMSEIYIKGRFTSGMVTLFKRKLPSGDVKRDVLLFGKRLSGEECARRAVVDAACEQDVLLDEAVRMARDCVGTAGFDRPMLRTMKEDVYRDVVEDYARVNLTDYVQTIRRNSAKL